MPAMIRILLLCSILIACGNEENKILKGEKLFNQLHIGNNNVIGCISCHSIKPSIETVGPNLHGIGKRAGFLVKGLNANQYIQQSITNPDAHIVSGYSPAIMFAHYQSELNKEEIKQLTIYLLEL